MPEARFCRACGAPLTAGSVSSNTGQNMSATIPLTAKGRTTDDLAGEESRRSGPDTGKVARVELEELLQSPDENAPGWQADKTVAYGPVVDGPPPTGAVTLPPRFDPAATVATSYDDGARATHTDEPPTGPVASLPPHPVYPDNPSFPPPAVAVEEHIAPVQPAARPAPRSKAIWIVLAVGFLLVALGSGLLAVAVAIGWVPLPFFGSRTGAAETNDASPIPITDQKSLVASKLAEADTLLASGDTQNAIARLREALGLDATNAEIHRRLGDALLKSGARRDAIESYRNAIANNPNDAAAWRALAAAQFDEGLYNDAAESYRQLVTANEAAADDNLRLSYAEALRLAGRAEEARAVYQRLISSASAEIAQSAREQLAKLPPAHTTPTPEPGRSPRPTPTQMNATPTVTPAMSTPTPTPVPTPTPEPRPVAMTPAEHYARGVELWSSNRAAAVAEFRAAQSIPDAHYYLGLSIAEGRDPASLNRADLVSALFHFQTAQSGPHGAQARRYADQLGRELDRRRAQGIR
jgi:tetratricopeptide (TPR) repeat protein